MDCAYFDVLCSPEAVDVVSTIPPAILSLQTLGNFALPLTTTDYQFLFSVLIKFSLLIVLFLLMRR